MEHFDASAGAAADDTVRRGRDALLRMQAVDADERLNRVLDDVDALLAEGAARDEAEGMDPGIADLLDRISGDEAAPLEFRSLHRRVSEGRLTWLDFWLHPEEEAGGTALIRAAMKAQADELDAVLADFDREERDHGEQGGPEWRPDGRGL